MTAPAAAWTRGLGQLAGYARRDSRARMGGGDPDQPVLCAFVEYQRERYAPMTVPGTGLIIVLEGRKVLGWGGQTDTFGPGTPLILPAGWEGEVVNDPDPASGRYRALVIGFPARLVRRALAAHPDARTSPPSRPKGWSLPKDPGLMEAVVHTAAALDPEIPAPLPPGLADHRVMEVLLWALHLGAPLTLPFHGPGRETLRGKAAGTTEAVRRLVALYPARPWTLALAADALGLGSATLRRRLAKAGTGFRALLAEERMAQADRLMREDALSPDEAAAACGYASSRRFSRRFRQVTGARPQEAACVSRQK